MNASEEFLFVMQLWSAKMHFVIYYVMLLNDAESNTI